MLSFRKDTVDILRTKSYNSFGEQIVHRKENHYGYEYFCSNLADDHESFYPDFRPCSANCRCGQGWFDHRSTVIFVDYISRHADSRFLSAVCFCFMLIWVLLWIDFFRISINNLDNKFLFRAPSSFLSQTAVKSANTACKITLCYSICTLLINKTWVFIVNSAQFYRYCMSQNN